jgi:G:T/U-mismatch repair DNA glycosylase
MTQKNWDKFVYTSDAGITIIKKEGLNVITHKFLDYQPVKDAETLIIGTFNPNAKENNANFFYSRPHNYLWRILPNAYIKGDLKKATRVEKEIFCSNHKIGFIDLIEEVNVHDGQEVNYEDAYLDKQEIKWIDIIKVITELTNLKRVCFSRSTFADIPRMNERIIAIEQYCKDKKIKFQRLITPARFYNIDKQNEWSKFLLND